MNPFFLFLLAIFSPFVLFVTLLAPIYGGIVGAAYIIYSKGDKIHPLSGKLLDVFYIIEVYMQLFTSWLAHMDAVSLVNYSLPLIGLPLIGMIVSLWLTAKLSRKLKHIFQLGAGI
ncbi:MAG: hypothetical protein V4735_04710 [Pseudomonadota bacterium]